MKTWCANFFLMLLKTKLLHGISTSNWDDFEKAFIGKFGNESTPTALLKELIAVKMDKREWIKDFNQRFTTILNKFSINSTLTKVVVEYCTCLHASIARFAK
jgi:hypothetical protein